MNIYFIKNQIFSLIIILQIFYRICSKTSFDYPYLITLTNDNIFIIQKTGIDIYDQSLKKLNQIIEFSGDEEINEEKFSKIPVKYNNEYIITVINDKMFIFNSEGKLLYKSKEKINNNHIINTYTLSFLNTTNSICDYILGYFDEGHFLNLYFYRYDKENNNFGNISYSKKSSYYYDSYRDSSEFKSENNLLSWEYLFYRSRNNLICFFNKFNTTLAVIYYEIQIKNDNIFFIGTSSDKSVIGSENVKKNISSIKSEINKNKTQIIVWWNFHNYNQTRYFIYDLNIINQNFSSFAVPNTCIREENVGINIFPTKNQFVFSCLIYNEFTQLLLFNKDNLTTTNDYYLLSTSCENINGFPKLYFNDNKNYYIYSCFKDCSDKKFENDTYCINKRRKTIIIVISIIIAIIILLIVLFILYRRYKSKFDRNWKEGKENEKLMNDIMTDFFPKNE